MKIAFDLKPQSGPFGGGNSFLSILIEGLIKNGFEVYFDLTVPNLDYIFLTDPRWRHPMRVFNAGAVSRYVRKYPNSLVIHRINECDERKNSSFMNKKLRYMNYLADSTVFVGTWLQNLDVTFKSLKSTNFWDSAKVIKNGSDERIYYFDEGQSWNTSAKLKIVTHHWSPNPMKGLEIYQKLDDLLSNKDYSDKYEFTYIGNIPKEATLINTNVLPPLFGVELGNELRKHNVYITGSKNEPGGNHQNEGGLCGLPIIFLNSGCMPEYCRGFGIEMQSSMELESALAQVRENYSVFRSRMSNFPNTATKMISEYVDYFIELHKDRNLIVRNRRLRKSWFHSVRINLPM
jgi:hypothetical protein